MHRHFRSLNDAHDDLEDILLSHQECLMIGAFDIARELLVAYRSLIELHISHEEERVLPVYGRADDKRWPIELFTGQHQRIIELLDRVAAGLAAQAKTAGWRRRVIALMETETTLKHLLEHHHLAEDQALYPTASEQSSPAEQELVQGCLAQWREAVTEHDELRARVRAALEA